MKAKRKIKILALVISFVMLVAIAVGIIVSAEGEEAPVIYSKNFAYEDNVYVYYAVKATDNVTANNTTLSIYSDAECTVALQSDITGTAENIPMLGNVIVFKAIPTKAKDITKVVYAQADTNGTKSEVVAYSLAEYLYERLYVAEKQGLTVIDEEKAFYQSLLEYGASAQTLFNNYGKPEAEREVLATDYKIVRVFNGTLSVGGAQKLVTAGTKVTATPTNNSQTLWEVTKIADDGTETVSIVNSSEEITVDTHTIIRKKSSKLKFDSPLDLNFFNLTTAMGYGDIESDVPQCQQPVALEIVDGALVLNSPVYHNNVITVNRTGLGTGTKAVFEADVTIDVGNVNSSTATGEALWVNFIFYDPTTGTQYTPFRVLLADGGTTATVTSEGTSETVTSNIKDNVKFTLRLEYLINAYGYNNTNIYIKPEGETTFTPMGRSTINATTSAPTPEDIGFKIEVNRFEDCTLTLDNVIFKSWNENDDEEYEDENEGGNTEDNTRFSLADGKTVNIISDANVSDALLDAIEEKTGVRPVVSATSASVMANELIIGQSNRGISQTAYSLLERLVPTHSYDQTYLIYSDGVSVAIAYNGYNLSDKYVIEYVCEYFAENLTNRDTVAIGTITEGELDAPAYQEAKDEQMFAAAWANLATEAGGGTLGAETVAAFQEMYSLYSDNAVYWLAELFDSVNGGFYYSNSGRDTEGFLPDIESTGQALVFLTGTGMTTSVYDALSPEIRNKLISFVKTRQDPDGYFYHPQWEGMETNITRLFRDVTYAEATLRTLNATPTYTTPNGMVGDGIVATAASGWAITAPMASSVSLAASRVIAVSDASVPWRLQNDTNFREYLATLDINKYSYEVGSEIVGQVGVIQQRDIVLKAQGANYSLANILVEWMNSKCYASTGHWRNVADYEGNNGLLKISDAYNKLGAALPYPEAAVRSAAACITSEDPALTVCFPYNTWFSVNNVFENVQKHNPQNAAALISEIREELRANVVETVGATYEKVLQFRKADGSFSYLIGETASHSSDMPVAVPHTDEGDVNATFICMCGIASGMFKALGYTYIPQYSESDMMRFNARLTELGEIVKSEYPIVIREANFDNETVGKTSQKITLDTWHTSEESTVLVVEDPREDREGNVLEVNGVNDGGKGVLLDLHRTTNADKSCIVFEGEFCFEWPEGAEEYWQSDAYSSATDPYSGYIGQIHITGASYDMYMIGITLDRATGTVRFRDHATGNGTGPSNDLGFTSRIGDWFKIKVEYYVGDAENVEIRVYFNDQLYVITDNYYSPEGNKFNGVDETQTLYTGTRLSVMSGNFCHVYMDNLVTYRDNVEYDEDDVPVTDEGGTLTFDDANDLSKFGLTTAMGYGSITSDVPQREQPVTLEIVNGALVLDSPVYHNNVISIDRTSTSTGTKAVFEADVTIDIGNANSSTETGEALWINFVFHSKTTGVAYTPFYVLLADGGTSATVTSEGTSNSVTSNIKDNVKFTLRLEYYINPYNYNNTLIYVKPDGADEFVAMGRSTINATTSAPTPEDIGFKIEVNRFEDCTLTLDNVNFELRN